MCLIPLCLGLESKMEIYTFPIVEFAKLIGKNTADFTRWDIDKYISWLWKRGKNMEENENTYTLELSEDELKTLKSVLKLVLTSKFLKEKERRFAKSLLAQL